MLPVAVIMAWLRIVLRLYCARNDANANSLMGASALTHNLSLVTHMSMLIVSDFIGVMHSRLHISLFQDYEETIQGAEINAPHFEANMILY